MFLFGVFNENESKYKQKGHASDNLIKYTINGFTEGSLPGQLVGLSVIIYMACREESHGSFISDVRICTHVPVSLHLVGMSSEPEVFSVHMNGQVLQQNGHKMSSVGLISGSSTTVSMVGVHPGRWLLSSHTIKHIQGKYLFNRTHGKTVVFTMNCPCLDS